MASSSKKPTRKKREDLVDWDSKAPYEIGQILKTDHTYIDNENLQAFDTGLFTGYFKDEEAKVWSVTLIPEDIKNLHVTTEEP